MEELQVPMHEQFAQDNEFFQCVPNDMESHSKSNQNYDISPLRSSSYSNNLSNNKYSEPKNIPFRQPNFDAADDTQMQFNLQFLKQLKEKQQDTKIQQFLQQAQINSKEQDSPQQDTYQNYLAARKTSQSTTYQPSQNTPQTINNTSFNVNGNIEPWQAQSELRHSVVQTQPKQGGEEEKPPKQEPEVQNMYMQIIKFYDKNLDNLKNILLQKDQELRVKDDKVRELNSLVQQMKTSFTSIAQKYESENYELMRRYGTIVEEFNAKRQVEDQRVATDKETVLKDYVLLKQQFVELNGQKMNLEMRMKDYEVKTQTDSVRFNDQRIKFEYMQNEISDLNQQKTMLEHQNQVLSQQFEQMRDNHNIEMSRTLQQQEGLSMKIQILQKQNFALQSQLQQQQIITQTNTSYHDNYQDIQQGFKNDFNPDYQNYLKSSQVVPNLNQFQFFREPPPKTQNSTASLQINYQQPPQQQQNNPSGIFHFPSDQKYYNQIDDINALHKDLQEMSFRKQQLEGELNKKIVGGKTINEKRKREIQEKEIDEINDNLSKIKLKLREFKQN